MFGQKTFHLLVVVMTRHDDHGTWGVVDGTVELSFLGMTQTNIGESLTREFNASKNYQLVDRQLEPH